MCASRIMETRRVATTPDVATITVMAVQDLPQEIESRVSKMLT